MLEIDDKKSNYGKKMMKITTSIDNCFFEDAHWYIGPKERTNYSIKESLSFRKQYTRNLLQTVYADRLHCVVLVGNIKYSLRLRFFLPVFTSLSPWMWALCIAPIYMNAIHMRVCVYEFRPYSTSSANQSKRLGKKYLHCKMLQEGYKACDII